MSKVTLSQELLMANGLVSIRTMESVFTDHRKQLKEAEIPVQSINA